MRFVETREIAWTVGGRRFALRLVASGSGQRVELRDSDGQLVEWSRDEAAGLAAALQRLLNADAAPTPRKAVAPPPGLENAGKPWTAELDADLTARWGRGEPVHAIARAMARTEGAIASRLVRLGLVPNREEALRLSEERQPN